jgi:hypothetical protein
MRRTKRLELEGHASLKKPVRDCGGRSTATAEPGEAPERAGWRPRERRLHFKTAVQYRPKNGVAWLDGVTENISRSGLLFRATGELPLGTALELILEMPAEITGALGSKVICQARVARLVPSPDGSAVLLAAAIDSYEYLPQGEVAGL